MDINYLEINNNTFNKTFDFYPGLKSLVINNNTEIKKIPSSLKNLEYLTINNSSINFIDELQNIECIQLCNCHNINIHNKNLINLQSLSLIECKNININVNGLINLKKLIINTYDDINNDLYKITTLEELSISNSNILQIPKSLINLKSLKLNNCYNIVEIPYYLFLKDISYQKCNIKIIY